MDDYIHRKRAICMRNQPAVEQVAARLDEASECLKSKISEVRIYTRATFFESHFA